MIFGSGNDRPIKGSLLDFGAPSIGATGASTPRAPMKMSSRRIPPRDKIDVSDLIYGGLGRPVPPARPRSKEPAHADSMRNRTDVSDLLYGGLGAPHNLATPPRQPQKTVAAKKKKK